MSTEEQMAGIGRLVTEAAESKKRVAILKSKLESLSKALQSASLHVNGVIQNIDNDELHAALASIPLHADVLAAVDEYRAEVKRAEELKTRVATLGL